MDNNATPAYEAPAITDIASVHELTLGRGGPGRGRKTHKRAHHASDGVRMANKVITS